MDLRWSLDELYESLSSKDFKADLERLESLIEDLKQWPKENIPIEENQAEVIEDYIKLKRDYLTTYQLLNNFAQLKLSVNVGDDKAAKTVERLEKLNTEIRGSEVEFQKCLGRLEGLDDLISQSELLSEHSFVIKELAKKSKYLLSDKEEVLLSELSNTGARAWYKLKKKLVSNLMVDIDLEGEDEQLPLAKVRNLAYNKKAEVRKEAYRAELDSYQKIEDSVVACLNSIKGESLTVAKKRGYDSPLEKSLLDSRIDQDILAVMLEAIEESLADFQKYYQKKGQLLGHQRGLPFYDLFAPLGEADMEFSYQQARDFIVKNFSSFSEKLGEFAQTAFKQNWIDAEPRQGKNGGAFCMNINPIGESRILANFTGSFSDVSTLAHELGHGYHGHVLQEESILNTNYTMPLAETASIFCETIITQAAIKQATKEESFSILENSLMGSGQVIVDIYSRFLFESRLFEERKDSSVSVDRLKKLMITAQKEAYGEGLDHQYLHPDMWINKIHYYIPGFDFYNYPYSFGLLFAKGLYARYLKEGDEFISEYDRLLSITGKKNVAEVAKEAGIDLYDISFWRDSLDLISKDIEKFITYANER